MKRPRDNKLRIHTQEESANCENAADADIEAIRAAYWAVKAASAHRVFSEEMPGLNTHSSQFGQRLNRDQSSQWLPEVAQQNRQKSTPQRKKPIIRQSGTSSKTHDHCGVITQTLSLQEASQVRMQHNMLETGFETGKILDLFNEEIANESLSSVRMHWGGRALSHPKLVAGIIGFCLLISSMYAGLGYWWITGSGFSHAAEPDSTMASPYGDNNKVKPSPHFLENIEALQNENNLIIPKESVEREEKLIAQAKPQKTFTMNELRHPVTEPTGRPDPFSPLIQEMGSGLNTLNDPKDKKDILADVEYTGFIGDVNSKDIVAVIKIPDPAAGGFKSLIKKTGESFYVDGERIYLKAIAKSALILRAEGVNRNLAINPYSETSSVSKEDTIVSHVNPKLQEKLAE